LKKKNIFFLLYTCYLLKFIWCKIIIKRNNDSNDSNGKWIKWKVFLIEREKKKKKKKKKKKINNNKKRKKKKKKD